jgi:transcriptional regulator with XRE-family HTH domain
MIGDNISRLRKKIGISQERLAIDLKLSRPIISQIEHNVRKVSADELLLFSKALNVSMEQLQGVVPFPEVSVIDKKSINRKNSILKKIRINIPQKNLTKFKQVFLYILDKIGAKPSVGETVIYKLLYFIDFDFYEKYEEQLMGVTYIKKHYGPTPVEFAEFIKKMINDNEIEKVKSKYFNFPQTKYLPIKKSDTSLLTGREIEVIDNVLNKLSNMNANQISEYSHKDVPWIVTEEGGKIEYESVFYRTPDYSVRDYGKDI